MRPSEKLEAKAAGQKGDLMIKKILITGLKFVIGTLIIGVIESFVLMISRVGGDLPVVSWVLHLFVYSTVLPIYFLMSGTSAIFFLKIPLIVVSIILIIISIRKRKLWLSYVAFILCSLYWLLIVYGVTGCPLD